MLRAARDKHPQIKRCQLLFGSFRDRFQSRQSLLVSGKFPVPEIREHAGKHVEKVRIGDASLAGSPAIRVISLYLPSESGIWPGDEFATDCTLRQLVCCCRDFAPSSRNRSRNCRDSAGFWRSGSDLSEPETAGSRPRRRSSPRFSLLPS